MLTQKEIQAQLKVNRDILNSLLLSLQIYRESLNYFYEHSAKTQKVEVKQAYLKYYASEEKKIREAKNKFLTLSAVQAKLKRMLANTARADAKSKEMKNV